MMIMMMTMIQVTLLILGVFCSSTWARPQQRQAGTSPEALACTRGLQQCLLPLIVRVNGMNYLQIIELIRTTDLRQTCGAVLPVGQCIRSVILTPECEVTASIQPTFDNMRRTLAAMHDAVEFVCVENVDVFNQHKECLLRAGSHEPALAERIKRQCPQSGVQAPNSPDCPSPEQLRCAIGVVSEECGEEIAGYIRTLGTEMTATMGCAEHKRLPSRLECEDGQIACSDGSGCFAEADLCDNFQDCADNSDEENCPSITCSDDEFLCEDDDICFPLSYRCDGQEDCFDGSDEQSCHKMTKKELYSPLEMLQKSLSSLF